MNWIQDISLKLNFIILDKHIILFSSKNIIFKHS